MNFIAETSGLTSPREADVGAGQTRCLRYEVHVLLQRLHLSNHIVLHLTDVAVEPVGDPVVVVLAHLLPQQVVDKLGEGGTSVPPHPRRVMAVNVSILLGKLKLVPVGRDQPLKWVPHNCEYEGGGDC